MTKGDPVRLKVLAACLPVATAMLVLVPAGPASAHPLGNATVNHYDGLVLFADHIENKAVEDVAEIPTFQRKVNIDRDGNGTISAPEATTYAAGRCADMARTVGITVNGRRVSLNVERSSYAEKLGQVSLNTGRLECDLTGPADLRAPARIDIASTWDDDGIGWHEITATSSGVTLKNSPFPAKSISDTLRKYPGDLLSSPLDVRSGTLTSEPGSAASTYRAVADLPVAGPVVRALDQLNRSFNGVAGRDHLTVGIGLLAVLLSMVLGAGHAFLPGHGKTIMAAYLVGRRGRLRDVVTVGATVTITHTAGVLILGLAITTSAAFAPAAAEKYLGVISGLIVAGVGLGLLFSALRRRKMRSAPLPLQVREPVAVGAGAPVHEHPHPHDHDDHPHDRDDHPHDHDHDHDHEARGHDHAGGHLESTPKNGFGFGGHSHGPGGHSHDPADRAFSKGGLVGLGVAGGLVPSPSALLVLLAAVALGRTAFGILLVLGYGLGMAGALTLAGLLLVKLRGRIDGWGQKRSFARAEWLIAALPVLTALLVLTVGTGLALRALGGSV